ncbi:3-oxoacyl-[acyl-carrier-protein] synthase III C-terminal domain-containing protein [Tsukamurella ocularis]
MLCSGGAVALQVAARYLAEGGAALITSGERYRGPAWDRWETHPDIGYGDGAAAVVIGSPGGSSEYAISGISQRTDSRLEGIERGDRPFTELPGAWPSGEELSEAREEFYARVGRDMLRESAGTNMAACAEEALADAGFPEIVFAVPPRLGPRLQRVLFGEALRSLSTDWRQLGRNTGHMGAGDSLVAIAQIMEGGLLEPGQSAAVVGGGGGFTWSCVILTRHSI